MSSKSSQGPGFTTSNVAVWDILEGVRNWRLWAYLGLQDIRTRYRRSAFGPLWLALGIGITILGIGILYSQILKADPSTFLPFFAISILVWSLVSSVLAESTGLFQAGAGMITSMRLPYTSFVLRCIVRNLIVMAHCIAPVVIAFVIFKFPVKPIGLMAIPGLLLLIANLYWISLGAGLLCLRYRDFAQIINYGTQLALFVTPIMWLPTQIKLGSPALVFNPFYHLIQLVRAPILYGRVPSGSYAFCFVMLIVGTTVVLLSFIRCRRRIVFWI